MIWHRSANVKDAGVVLQAKIYWWKALIDLGIGKFARGIFFVFFGGFVLSRNKQKA